MLRKKALIILLFILITSSFLGNIQPGVAGHQIPSGIIQNELSDDRDLFIQCGLEGYMDTMVFHIALAGYRELTDSDSLLLTIIDYTKPSTEKRFFVIDLQKKELRIHTYVAHGKNTGENHARLFSNKPNSLKSSPGFFQTGEAYRGKHGYSLRLDGMEKGINDNARKRAVVIHGASYVSPEFIKKHKRLGRSWGCPAVPKDESRVIIDLIKGGSCVYIHTNNPEYFEKSSFVKR
jgi:hypothetical protein